MKPSPEVQRAQEKADRRRQQADRLFRQAVNEMVRGLAAETALCEPLDVLGWWRHYGKQMVALDRATREAMAAWQALDQPGAETTD